MKKFEYKTIVLHNPATFNPESKLQNTQKKLLLVEKLESKLNQLANDSWEIISICPGIQLSMCVILKRDITN